LPEQVVHVAAPVVSLADLSGALHGRSVDPPDLLGTSNERVAACAHHDASFSVALVKRADAPGSATA
jgi:hypothetical protein